MLAHVDPFTHSDKFSVLQLIQVQRAFGKAYVVYTRGGSTGTVGQSTEQEFYGLGAAVACFKDELEQKTGLDWKDRMDPIKPNKYRFVVQNFTQKQAGFSGGTWQYWVDDGIDGKVCYIICSYVFDVFFYFGKLSFVNHLLHPFAV